MTIPNMIFIDCCLREYLLANDECHVYPRGLHCKLIGDNYKYKSTGQKENNQSFTP